MAESAAQTVARLAADAIAGQLKITFSQGMSLASVFKQYNATPAMKKDAISVLAQLLTESAPDLAAALCDELSSRIGK